MSITLMATPKVSDIPKGVLVHMSYLCNHGRHFKSLKIYINRHNKIINNETGEEIERSTLAEITHRVFVFPTPE